MKSKNMIGKIFLCCIILLFTFLSTSAIAEYDNQELELSELSETEEKIYFPMTDTMAFYGTESEYKKFQEGMNQKEINQGENSNSEFETKNSSNMHVVGATSLSGYETKIEDNELANPNDRSFSISGDKSGLYFFFDDCVKRLALDTKKYEVYLTFEKNAASINFYTKGNVVYFIQSVDTASTDPILVQGYDLIKKEKVFEKTFDGLQDADYRAAQFLIDDNMNFYFLVAKGTISSFDKNGNFIQTISTGSSSDIMLTQVSPDNKNIIYVFPTSYEDVGGYVAIDNGSFVGITSTGIEGYLYFNTQFGYTKTLVFNDDCTYAFNSNGYIMTYSHYRSEKNVQSNLKAIYYTEPNSKYVEKKIGCFDGDYIYIYSKDDTIIKYDTKTQTPVASVEFTPETRDKIVGMKAYNGSLYILLTSRYTQERTLHELFLLDFEEIEPSLISDHVTYDHTKEEIISKYKNSQKKFDYSNSIYLSEPVLESPFSESTLKDEVKQDTLNKINYYRWLVGLNSVSINEERMYKNARGALLMNVTGQFTHYPSIQPSGMSDEFFADAKEGVGADTTYSGNISRGETNPSDTISGYVWDNYNSVSNVGHRTAMLDPTCDKISFGQSNKYNATSMYYATETLNNNEEYYAYPPAGYFPLEELPYTMSKELRWSITLNGNFLINTYDLVVKLTYNNKEYEISGDSIDYSYETISFLIPDELKNELVDSTKYITEGKKVKVEVTKGLFDYETNGKAIISYTTEFIKANIIEPTEINTYIDGEKVTSKECYIGKEYDVSVEFVPSNTTYQDYTVEIENTNIASYDAETKKLNAKAIGSTKIYVKNYLGNTINTIEVNVKPVDPTEINTYIDGEKVTSKECYIGKEYDVSVEFVPSNTTYQDYTIEIENTNIASYDAETKKLNAKAIGTTKLYVRNYLGNIINTVIINVNEYYATITYRTHVQNIGWQNWVNEGEMSGTSGLSLRLEGIEINLQKEAIEGEIEYSTHVQNIGWQDFVTTGQMSGTSGWGLRLEAIKIRLTDELAEKYDIYYRVHAQNAGWLGWAKNGEESGTAGYGFRLEGIEIELVKKGEAAPGNTDRAFVAKAPTVEYTTHVQNMGWQEIVKDGETSGTLGLGLRIEGIKINLSNNNYEGNIEYSTHIQDIGWQDFMQNGQMSGTSGLGYRLEAIKIRLTDELSEKCDIYYRVHAQNAGWLGWAKNGEEAGTSGYGFRLEGIQIVILDKGSIPPGSTENAFVKNN